MGEPMLRMAVVGMGWAGTRHVEAIHELNKKIEVVALVDTDGKHLEETAAALARSTGAEQIRTFIDYGAVLADREIDAVSICTPHATHCPMALQAAEQGKHILVEKPIALTVEDATRMIDAAEANGVRIYVAENATYTPMARFLRHVVQSGRPIGQIVAASLRAGFRSTNFGYPGRRNWLTSLADGGTGTWMLHGIHTVGQMRYVLGEVSTIYMQEHKADSFERRDLEGTMSGLLTLKNGLSVSVLQTCESKMFGDLGGYLLHGESGSIRATADGYWLFNSETDGQRPQQQSYPESTLSDYALEMDAFADYINGAAIGPTTGFSERRTLAVVQAGYESARTGQPINLGDHFGAALYER